VKKTGATAGGLIVAVWALVIAAYFLGGWLLQLGWDNGIAPLVADAGGHVGHIGYWTSVWSYFFLTIAGGALWQSMRFGKGES
jgi:hypothetical protein